jgi:hypothetical protein
VATIKLQQPGVEVPEEAGTPVFIRAPHLLADLRACRHPNLNTNRRVASMLRITPWRVLKAVLFAYFLLSILSSILWLALPSTPISTVEQVAYNQSRLAAGKPVIAAWDPRPYKERIRARSTRVAVYTMYFSPLPLATCLTARLGEHTFGTA